MHITSPPGNPELSGASGLPSSKTSTEKRVADQKKATSTIFNIFLSAAAAIGGHLFTSAVTLLRGSSHVLGKFMVALGSTMLKQLKAMVETNSKSSTPHSNSNILQNAKAYVVAGAQTKETIGEILKAHQENQEKLLEKFKRQYPTKYPSGKTSKTPSSEPTTPPKGLARAAEDYKRENDTTIFQNIINQSFDDPKKAEGAVNFLAKKLDEFIDSTIKEAVEKNPAIDASKTANEIAQAACSQNRIDPSENNIKELSTIIARRINVRQNQQDSMVQELLLSKIKSLAKLPVAPGLPAVPTHEIKVSNRTTDPTSRKDRVVQNAFNALKKMYAENEKEYNSRLDKLYETFSEPLSNKTDAKTIELIGKEYDRMMNEQDPKKK